MALLHQLPEITAGRHALCVLSPLEVRAWCRHRNTPASQDKMSSIQFTGLLNFTNSQQLAGANSGNCLINSLEYAQEQPLQEVIM